MINWLLDVKMDGQMMVNILIFFRINHCFKESMVQNCSCDWSCVMMVVGPLLLVLIMYKFFRGGKYQGPQPNLTGKVMVITGGNCGIGKQTAKYMAKLGCAVVIGARDRNKSQQCVKQIKNISKNQLVEYIHLDLADKKSIEDFVKSIKYQQIDYLVNNAGLLGTSQLQTTKSGFELHHGVNHQGHFYLTYLLWSKLNKSSYYRIINVASLTHLRVTGFLNKTTLDFQNINFQKGGYYNHLAYARSKLYNVLFTKHLTSMIPSQKGISLSLHPGVVQTQFLRSMPCAGIMLLILKPFFMLFFKTPWDGAQTTIHTLLDNSLTPGGYYSDCKKSKESTLATTQNSQKLWKISEDGWGVKFN